MKEFAAEFTGKQCKGSTLILHGSGFSFLSKCGSGSSSEKECRSRVPGYKLKNKYFIIALKKVPLHCFYTFSYLTFYLFVLAVFLPSLALDPDPDLQVKKKLGRTIFPPF
jgi:hypothetical protein